MRATGVYVHTMHEARFCVLFMRGVSSEKLLSPSASMTCEEVCFLTHWVDENGNAHQGNVCSLTESCSFRMCENAFENTVRLISLY